MVPFDIYIIVESNDMDNHHWYQKILVRIFLVVEKENQLLDLVIIDHYHYHQVNYEEVLMLMFD